MADAQDLKDCPFCGCAATYVKHSAGMPGTLGHDKWDAVACKHCRATVGACDRRFRSRDDARAAWNCRIAAQPTPAAREPLTDEVMKAIFDKWANDTTSIFDLMRAIEAAHGITATAGGEEV